MHRFVFFVLLFVSAGLHGLAVGAPQQAGDLPPRPAPFQFVNDQAKLMTPADVKKLEGGLRRYADNTGTQVVVVTVPTLGGRDVADYGRALGEAWGVGQRDKNNGIVVLIGAQERTVTIQPGSGLRSTITPAVTSRVISQMAPSFKQGNYFAGLRTGLNTLMLTANPASNPQKGPADEAAAGVAAGGLGADEATEVPKAPGVINDPVLTPPRTETTAPGWGMGTILFGALLVGGVLWLLVRMFRRRSAAPAARPAPEFLPSRGPAGGPNPGNMPRGSGSFGGGGNNYGAGPMGGGGSAMGGMGGILATGAAAAAGAYLGNRMASGHEAPGQGLAGDGGGPRNLDPATAAGAGAGAGAGGTGAANDYFAGREDGGAAPAPDYFADDVPADTSQPDFFSSDDASSYDDPNAGDSGGGGFDGGDDNSGSW